MTYLRAPNMALPYQSENVVLVVLVVVVVVAVVVVVTHADHILARRPPSLIRDRSTHGHVALEVEHNQLPEDEVLYV